MRRILLIALALLGAMLAWACGLNPQPYPPETYDASPDVAGNVPQTGDGSVDGSFLSNDGGEDATPGANLDGSTDADAEATDAAEEGGSADASGDALEDAPGD